MFFKHSGKEAPCGSPRVRAGSAVGLGWGAGSSWMGVPLMSLAILAWEGSLWGSQEKLELWRKFEGA